MHASLAVPPALVALAPAPTAPRPRPWRAMLGLGLGLLVLAGCAVFMARVAVEERRDAILAATSARLEALAHGRAEVLATWMEGVEALGRRLTRSELVQLFTTELALVPGQEPLPEPLREQMPYMRQVMDDLARQGDLVGVYLVDAEGRLLLADAGAPPLGAEAARAAADAARAAADARLGLPAPMGDHLVADLAMAVPAAQVDLALERAPGVALVLRVAVDLRLDRLLAPGPLDLPGQSLRLRLADGRAIAAGPDGTVVVADAAPPAADALRGTAVAGATGWSIEQAVGRAEASAPLADFRRSLVLAMVAGGLLLAIVGSSLWWRQARRHQAELVGQYRDLSERLRQQRDLLQGIMSAVPDLIGLKDGDGAYVFANPVLAAALGSTAEAVGGRTDAELFAADTAALLQRLDREAVSVGCAARDEVEVALRHRRRHLAIVVVPLAGAGGEAVGTVLVARDVTEAVARRRERQRLVEQTTAALARTIELADPYLLGHSRRMASLACDLARSAGLAEAEIETARVAATLSQIGKIFVPRDILTKPERHDEAERAAMRRHVDHAVAILRDVGLDLPVADAVAQMHERLDGTGYPAGLQGGQISAVGRILAVADVFCARTRPRGYREAGSAAATLERMREHPGRYDAAVVEALAGLVEGDALADLD